MGGVGGVGSVSMPTWVLRVLLLLRTIQGPVKSLAFVGAITTMRLLQGVIFGVIIEAYKGIC